MKKVILLFLISFSFAYSYAQEISYGLKAGLNLATMKSSISQFNDAISSRTAFHVGGVVEIKFSDKFSVQPEILYNSVGAKIDASLMARAETPDVSYVIDYLSIPVMAKYYVMDGLSLDLGPQLGILLSSKMKVDSESEDMKDQTESMDFGLGFGAGYKLENGLFLDARYVLGLSNLAKDIGDDESVKNNVFQFSVGYKFM